MIDHIIPNSYDSYADCRVSSGIISLIQNTTRSSIMRPWSGMRHVICYEVPQCINFFHSNMNVCPILFILIVA